MWTVFETINLTVSCLKAEIAGYFDIYLSPSLLKHLNDVETLVILLVTSAHSGMTPLQESVLHYTSK